MWPLLYGDGIFWTSRGDSGEQVLSGSVAEGERIMSLERLDDRGGVHISLG